MATSGGQQRLDWYAVPGVPLTLILDTADGSDWPSAPRVLVGPREADGDITPVLAPLTATITPTPSRATLTLTDAQMATILTAYPVGSRTACPWHVRLGTGESEVAVSTGYLIWDVTGRIVTTSAQLVVGPPGPTGVAGFLESQTPTAPAVGESATYWVVSGVIWPAGVLWDDGGEPVVGAGGLLVTLFTAADGVVRGTYGLGFAVPATTTTTTTAATTTTTTTAATTTTTTTAAATTTTTTTAGPTLLASESFTRADDTSTGSITTEVGNFTTNASTWVAFAGQIGGTVPAKVSSGRMVQPASGNGCMAIEPSGGTTSLDFAAEIDYDLTGAASTSRIYLQAKKYFVHVRGDAKLYGAEDVLATGIALSGTLRLERIGTEAKVYINGSLLATVTGLPVSVSDGGRHGCGIYTPTAGGAGAIDNFKVWTLP